MPPHDRRCADPDDQQAGHGLDTPLAVAVH
jgi:hypothetical protein